MKSIKSFSLSVLLLMSSSVLKAETEEVNGLTIAKIRAVGNYQGTTYDNTVELWFSQPIVWTKSKGCNDTRRVEIDAKDNHLISAAYLAFSTGKKVTVFVDDSLPVRGGICQISYLDVTN